MKFSEIAARTSPSKISMGATRGKPEALNAMKVASALTLSQVTKRSDFLTRKEESK